MDHITAAELALWRAQGHEFALLDVRRANVRAQHGADIAGARWFDPAAWLDWKAPRVRIVVASLDQPRGRR